MRTQSDRDDDLAIGRQLERKDAEIDRLRFGLEAAINWIDPATDPSTMKAGEMAASLRAVLAYQQGQDHK